MRPLILSSLLFFFVSAEALAARPSIASVIKMRGTVTKLLPGALEATVVSEGDQLQEDTSVVTGAKSFVKIKFIDNSELNMGPESKIVISEMKADSAGVISLLKGRIRTEVQKVTKDQDQAKNKFYIRTRTAAMGVRGTDFQTIYNPDNRMTSLLTYKGAVALAKVDESTHQRFEEGTTEVTRNDVTKAPEVKQIPGKVIDEKAEMEKILSKNDAVVVPPGQNAFSSDALKKSSLPVKISPVQLNALYKNREFDEKNLVNLKSGVEVVSPKMELAVAPQKVAAEGLYNAKTGDFAPRAGGFIDQETGLYVAPEAGSTFDEKNGVYVSKKSGDFDADTGQYVAPKGLILDAKKGFVVEKSADVKPELLALREDLNKSIARDVVVGDLDGEVVIAAKTLKEKFIRDHGSVSLLAGKEELEVSNASGAMSTIDSDSLWGFNLNWQLSSTNRFAPFLGLGYNPVKYKNLGINGYTQDSKALIDVTLGLKYALTNRVDLISKIVLDQAHYAAQTSTGPDVYQFKRIVVTKFNLGGSFEVMRSNNFFLTTEAFLNMGFRKKFNNLVVSKVSGFNLKVLPQLAIDEKRGVSGGLFLENEKATLTNSVGSSEQKRNKVGLEVGFNQSF